MAGGDARELASRARAIAILTVERHQIERLLLDEEASLVFWTKVGAADEIKDCQNKLALLREQLARITPSRRQTATTAEEASHD